MTKGQQWGCFIAILFTIFVMIPGIIAIGFGAYFVFTNNNKQVTASMVDVTAIKMAADEAANKAADAKRGFRDRRQQTLFIDARKLGTLIDRVHRELTDADLEKITSTYHAWRGDTSALQLKLKASTAPSAYADVPGFCKSATTAEIAAHGHVLTPGRYVGAEEVEDDGDPFEEKMPRLVAELNAQFAESAKLESTIRKNLKGLGYAL